MEVDLDGDDAAHVIPFLIKHNYVKEGDHYFQIQNNTPFYHLFQI